MKSAVIVAPDQAWRVLLSVFIEKTHNIALATEDHRAAIAWLQQTTLYPHLLVIDVADSDICSMPIFKVLQNNPRLALVHLVLIGISPSLRQKTCAQEFGASAFLPKPFTYHELQNVIETTAV